MSANGEWNPTDYWANYPDIRDWLRSKGYAWSDDRRHTLEIAWSTRIGYDSTGLGFYAHAKGLEAVCSHHASGTNPRLSIGTCTTLEDVQRTHETIRLINGYEQPESERMAVVEEPANP